MRLSALGLILALALGIVAVPLAAAQQATKVYRIGWLSSGNPPSGPTPNFEAFQRIFPPIQSTRSQ